MTDNRSRISVVLLCTLLAGESIMYWRSLEKTKRIEQVCIEINESLDKFYNDETLRQCEFKSMIELAAMLHLVANVDGKYPSGKELLDSYYSPEVLLGYKEETLDLWGMPYRSETIPILISSGADGKFDTFDDIFTRIESQPVTNILTEIKCFDPAIENEFIECRQLGAEDSSGSEESNP